MRDILIETNKDIDPLIIKIRSGKTRRVEAIGIFWAVNEASTAELMVDFHKDFTSGHTASMALTLAKRKL